MNFLDVIVKILSEGYPPSEYGGTGIAVSLVASMILSIYIFFCYRVTGRRTFYSKLYNLCLLGAGPITCAIILLKHQNAIAGIGVLGTLAVIRPRGAVKEPMDTVFVLWSVACGVFIAAGKWRIGIIVSIIMTAAVVLLDMLPTGGTNLILSVYGYPGENINLNETCGRTIRRSCTGIRLVSDGKVDGRQNLVMRVRTKQRLRLTNELANLPGIDSVTLLEQNGEI